MRDISHIIEKYTMVGNENILKEPKRRNYNLLKIFDELNAKYFGGTICAGITWKRMRLYRDLCVEAVACVDTRVIYINEVLDDIRFPVWYLKATIHHEMLHIYLGRQIDVDGNEQADHCNRFCSLESQYPDYEKVKAFFASKRYYYIFECWRKYRLFKRQQKVALSKQKQLDKVAKSS